MWQECGSKKARRYNPLFSSYKLKHKIKNQKFYTNFLESHNPIWGCACTSTQLSWPICPVMQSNLNWSWFLSKVQSLSLLSFTKKTNIILSHSWKPLMMIFRVTDDQYYSSSSKSDSKHPQPMGIVIVVHIPYMEGYIRSNLIWCRKILQHLFSQLLRWCITSIWSWTQHREQRKWSKTSF